ncbi:SGNH/GDSL hydrolase family protein [Streptomyces sp. NPDC002588]|uniref:SGNH/GDSL hydrolase family protein n=1 Tax=Streptomyces sp. NPDC002588 TaxID=3154419 RepID=UPI00331BEFFE
MVTHTTRGVLARAVIALAAAVGLTGIAGGPAPAATEAAQPTALRVMPLGDSITWGEASSTGNGYRSALWNDLAAEGHDLDFVGSVRNGPMADPDNEGHQGWRIDQIASIADASLARYRPNVVTLEIGTNDMLQNYQVSTAADRLRSLVDQITADVPDATVLVASLIVSTSAVEEPNRPAYNQAVPGIVQAAQAAGKHVRYVDMSAVTTADLVDGVHPNDAGYAKMADAFNAGIQAADSAGWIHQPLPDSALPGTWDLCATENGTCAAGEATAMAYGANGRFNYLTSTGSAPCTNAIFKDPIPSTVKACYRQTAPPADNVWSPCATEGGTCAFSGVMTVAFGANGSFRYATLPGGTACTDEVFGDPIFGTAKSCYLISAPPSFTTWTSCAAENGTCSFSGEHEVAYGAGGRFVYRSVTGSTECSNSVFDDPAPGTRKSCYVQ